MSVTATCRASYFENSRRDGLRYKHDVMEYKRFLFSGITWGVCPFSSMRVQR